MYNITEYFDIFDDWINLAHKLQEVNIYLYHIIPKKIRIFIVLSVMKFWIAYEGKVSPLFGKSFLG